MKKLFLLLALTLLACSMAPALAEEARTAPEDWELYMTTDKANVETIYKKYDATFYEAACAQPGTIVRVDYTTDAYGDTLDRWANVYVPSGYDATKEYNIIYFLHGTNETQESYITDERAKNAMDNMFDVGIAEPTLMVFPTYYYDYENRAVDQDAFIDEVRNDLMPVIETAYNTYAPTADAEGFTASREHRAFGGYSQGSMRTWAMLAGMLDYSKWYLPFSGGTENDVRASIEAQGDYDFFLYLASGGPRDMCYEGVVALVNTLAADTEFYSYGNDPAVNNLFYCMSKDIHQTLMSRYYFYNAFDTIFH